VQERYPVQPGTPDLLSRGGGIEVLIPHGVILHGHMVCRPNSVCRAIGKKVRPEKTDLARVFIFLVLVSKAVPDYTDYTIR